MMGATIAAAAMAAAGGGQSAAAAPACELHVWPTRNYLAINTGLLSGLGPIGAVADIAAHKNRVRTVVDLMGDYLPPEQQVRVVDRVGGAAALKLAGYRVVAEEPLPSAADVKADPAAKARADEVNARIKSGRRLSAAAAPCYAELIATTIFYHKAALYGSNLFGGWVFRDYRDGQAPVKVAKGAVKNPLGVFPPRTPDAEAAARAELLDAYGKDYLEWVGKKAKP